MGKGCIEQAVNKGLGAAQKKGLGNEFDCYGEGFTKINL